MTEKQKAEYWREYARVNTKWERSGIVMMDKVIRDSIKPIERSIKKIGAEKTLLILDGTYTPYHFVQSYESLYRTIGDKAIEWHAERIWRAKSGVYWDQLQTKEDKKPLFGFGFINQRWIDRIRRITTGSEIGKRITSVAETIKAKIRESLSQAMNKFVSPDKIAAQLRKDLGGEFSRKRAALIVRTETTYISNIAAEQAANELEAELGMKLTKVWIATRDERTRDAHRAMIGQKPIPKESKFLVGGVPMDKPGDPAGGLSNIINCRCVVSYLPADDDDLSDWE